MPAEMFLQPGQDRPGRPDGELLPGHLEDQRPKRVEPGKFVDPRARMEVGMRLDYPGEHRIGVPEELARRGIGDRCGGHVFSSRSVSTISMTSATVFSRAQSRCSSTASATQVTGCAPARTTRSRPVRCASSLVPPIASTTG